MLKHLMRQLSIQKKILISFIIIVCFSVLCTTFIASFMLSKILEDKVVLYNQQIVNKTLENIEYYLFDIKELSKNIFLDEDILNFLNYMNKNNKLTRDLQDKLDDSIKMYQFMKSYITDISIFNEKNETLYNFGYDYKSTFFDQSWYKNYFKVSTDMYFSDKHESIIRGTGVEGIETFTFFKKIYDTVDPSLYLGTLSIELNANVISNSMTQLNSKNEWKTFILNENNDIMFRPLKNADIFTPDLLRKMIIDSPPQNNIIKVGKIKYIFLNYLSSKSNWKIVSIIPYNDLMWEVFSIRFYLIFIGVLLLLLTVLFSSIISKSITSQLSKLIITTKEIGKGNFDIEFVVKGNDEIKELSDVLNSMVVNIKTLIAKNVGEEKLKRKAEFTALQAQINPHFLYNTLDSVNWLAVRKKESEISDVLTNLGKFFRISLSKGSQFIPISQEFEHVNSYINIQAFRHSYNFVAKVSLSDEITDLYCPKLVLQPIVENSLIHGLKNKESNGTIEIKGFIENDHVFFCINDDGIGISPSTLAEINNQINGLHIEDFHSYGLKNVNGRIQIYFGKQYGVTIQSEVNIGTQVTIAIPILRAPPDE